MKKVGEFWVPDDENYAEMLNALENGGWQLDLCHRVIKQVPKKRVAVDGGAYVGSWTREFAEHFDEVYAFEPSLDNFSCLQRNIEEWQLQNIKLHGVALGNRSDTVGLSRSELYPESNSCIFIDDLSNYGAIMKPLDYFQLKQLDLLKLDVEGYEPLAIDGAYKTINKYRPLILVEIKHKCCNRIGTNWSTIFIMLQRLRYYIVGYGHDFLFIPE